MSVAAVILAAGASTRLGYPKQLILLHGETLLDRAIRLASEAGADPIFVVLGAHREQIQASAKLIGATLVFNPDWKEGIASSIRAGIAALEDQAMHFRGALLMVADQPSITAEHLRALLSDFFAVDPGIAASTYGGVTGIPAVFSESSFAALNALTGDAGARTLLRHPPVPLTSRKLVGGEHDIDTPEDLAGLP